MTLFIFRLKYMFFMYSFFAISGGYAAVPPTVEGGQNDPIIDTYGVIKEEDTSTGQTTSIMNRLVGADQCIDLAEDKKNIVFNACNDSESQKWTITQTSTINYNTIKNSTLDGNICLFSAIDGKKITMQACNSGKYSSQAYWSVNKKKQMDIIQLSVKFRKTIIKTVNFRLVSLIP